jgi:hypothetical protein
VKPIALRAQLALLEFRAARTAVLKAPYVEQGLTHADRALKLDPQNLDALEARGQLKKARWDLQVVKGAEADKLLEDARADLDFVTQQDQTRPQALVALSAVQTQLKQPTDAYVSAVAAYRQDAFFSGVEDNLVTLFQTSFNRQEFGTAHDWCVDEGYRRFPTNWRFVACQLNMRVTPNDTTSVDSAWKELETLQRLLPANVAVKEFQYRRNKMWVAATIAKKGLRDSVAKVLESARTKDKAIDPNGNLLTAEALVRLRLGTAVDTAAAFELLKEYVVTQPLHGRGFLETQMWYWSGLRRDDRWNSFLRRAAAGS